MREHFWSAIAPRILSSTGRTAIPMIGLGKYWPCACRALSTTTEVKQTVFSGIQPTGVPHLGNYLGALRHWVDLQKDSATTLLYSLVDLHAITMPQSSDELRMNRRDAIISLLAAGLDPERAIIFEQSSVPAHAELAWILSCTAPLGYLNRMTQFKSKGTSNANLGLFAYPVLQAADILLYQSTAVPVGQDQTQHLELTRELASKFNKTFGRTFPLPKILLTESARVLSLRDPLVKMSKSDKNPNSRILLTDTAEQVALKIGAAITDGIAGISFEPDKRPGISNLVAILSGLTRDEPTAVAHEYSSLRHSDFKQIVTDVVNTYLEPMRREHRRLQEAESFVNHVLRQGTLRASTLAENTMHEVCGKVGLARYKV